MKEKPPPEFVVRLGDVVLNRQELEGTLGVALDRYEPSRNSSQHYAQISLAQDADQWNAIVAFLEKIGPRIADLLRHQMVGSACMDFAIYATTEKFSISTSIPANVAELAGRYLIDIEMSFYPSLPEM